MGWQAAYTPTEIEKRHCEEAAHKGGFKSEECKTIWERTTTDPVAFFTFWLSISTIGLWVVTANAARDSKRAANIAEDALVKLERAFVSFAFDVSGAIGPGAPNTAAGWQITPVWKNSGKTPTRGLHTHVSWDHFPTTLPANFTFPDGWFDPSAPRINPSSYIGPLDSIRSDTLSIESGVLEAARQDHLYIYVWGWVEYDDIFDNTPPHRTEFCHRVVVFNDPYAVVQNAAPFGLALQSTHTGADEDCYRQARPRELRSQPIV
ncbi:hypothetical protein [Bradyrhizobium sp. AZCC 2289]|uniref:hypothetical protein n=1 Tax=Bradyrhizobium sp. AZCC 2289 TaxID=3117026 RepID=UPI002FF1FCE9